MTGPGQAQAFSELPAEGLRERVLDEVRTLIAAAMDMPAADLDLRRPLHDQGLDSVTTVAIRKRLEKRSGQRLDAGVFWQEPTVIAITDYLVGLLSQPR